MTTSNRRIKIKFALVALVLTGLCLTGAEKGVSMGPPDHNAKPSAEKKPLRVFILSGQSNMQGHAHIRTFDPMALDPKTAPILKEMRRPDGTPRVCQNVWISSIGSAEKEQVGKLTVGFGAKRGGPKIGPEFTFGIYMQKLLNEPILIIKTAWGGKSLHTDFRPPSATRKSTGTFAMPWPHRPAWPSLATMSSPFARRSTGT